MLDSLELVAHVALQPVCHSLRMRFLFGASIRVMPV
jgi:hypothetical protein